MAFDFLKKGFFKKNKETTHSEEHSVQDISEPVDQEDMAVKTEALYQTQEEKENAIKERLCISENSPLKLLWNVYYGKSDAEFKPLEYVLKPIIETNTRLNEISESQEYENFDDNQKEFLEFVKKIHSVSVKTLKQLFQESLEGSVDDYSKNIEIHAFDSVLQNATEFSSYDEFKFACENNRKELRKKPVDAQIILYTSKDKIHAWLMIIPPLNGGAAVNEEAVSKYLYDNSVISGIDKTLISAICQKKKFLQIFEVARGSEPVQGKDGKIIDKYQRHNNINIREDERGNINYKELNNVNSVHVDDVICEIIYPTEGVDGKRVDGKVITARQGKKPKIPQGKNIDFNEDKSKLVAMKDGELLFKDGVFMINELLTIEHDVDNASGNINFSGDVLIKGDVREGFSVKAEGNINILGTAEGATIVSARNVTIQHGMTGGGKGIIRASGNVKCLFLENCTVQAQGNIDVDQVMYSELQSGDSIHVSGKKGSVTGGKLVAGKSIKANVIGAANNACLKTDIVIGCTPQMIKRQINIAHSLKEVTEKLFKANQDINYIESNIDRMPKERLDKLEQLKVQAKFMTLQKEKLEANLEELTLEMEETTKACDLKCKTLNPIVNLTVGESTHVINRPLMECHMFMRDKVAVLCSSSLSENIEF
ncbi:MAG: DUF342 domain-containing protein [Oscillospiraceae bacterium]|nr:DUF342 domain-containing protein [Oscillospiraceae bacterium]